MKVKRHMRDLGHEQYGPCARRLVELGGTILLELPRRPVLHVLCMGAVITWCCGVTPLAVHQTFSQGVWPSGASFFPQHDSSDHVTMGHFQQDILCVPSKLVSAAASDN